VLEETLGGAGRSSLNCKGLIVQMLSFMVSFNYFVFQNLMYFYKIDL